MGYREEVLKKKCLSYTYKANFFINEHRLGSITSISKEFMGGGVLISVAVSQCVQTQQQTNECSGGCQNHFHNGRIS